MAEYHVGCGFAGIYAGTLEPRNKNLWRNKSDVTDEALSASAQYLMDQDVSFVFVRNGEKYVLSVDRLSNDEDSKQG